MPYLHNKTVLRFDVKHYKLLMHTINDLMIIFCYNYNNKRKTYFNSTTIIFLFDLLLWTNSIMAQTLRLMINVPIS